jgi:DNA-binding NarL/FixJ family response regulator
MVIVQGVFAVFSSSSAFCDPNDLELGLASQGLWMCPKGGGMQSLTKLSRKEQAVLSLLTDGLSDQEIAGELDVEITTIRSHLKNLCAKLSAINRVQLAVLGVKAGLSR